MLTIPREDLLALAGEYGLPLFVYDAEVIRHQIRLLKESFGSSSPEIRYACKALNTIAVLRLIHQNGCGIDTVSPGEIMMAMKAGVPADQISFTPSGVLPAEYQFAIEKGVRIHVDQLSILQWIEENFPGAHVTLRFNPGVKAGGHHKVQVGSSGSKFGLHADQVEEVKDWTDQSSLRINGVHMHLGSDISESTSFDEAYDYLLSVAMLWKDTLDHVDLGGGFKVPYHPEDHAIDMVSFGSRVSRRFDEFCKSAGKKISLVIEPGKFLVSQSGYFLMETSAVREAGTTDMAFLYSGFNHFVRPMNYEAYHHLVNLSNPNGELNKYDVVGYLCETDTFALNRKLNQIRQGDIIALLNAGAYGYSMASNYNGRPRPAEVIYDQGNATLIRRAETIEDILRTDLSAHS
ncbi:MAG TPA: diaminopimelate decarboxylase [Saprospiraceae bacterium]|nr:diaminopimelate decarboxylase [Saprospiraceae bacterium]